MSFAPGSVYIGAYRVCFLRAIGFDFENGAILGWGHFLLGGAKDKTASDPNFFDPFFKELRPRNSGTPLKRRAVPNYVDGTEFRVKRSHQSRVHTK